MPPVQDDYPNERASGKPPVAYELLEATRAHAAATLAATLIRAADRPHSPEEAADLCKIVHNLLFRDASVQMSVAAQEKARKKHT